MAVPVPDYSANIPLPSNLTWLFGDSIREYKTFSGFHKAAKNCLVGIFPDPDSYEGFRFNPDDLFDFSEEYVNVEDMIWENKDPLIFGAIGAVFAFSLLLLGMVWCCYKCCCSKGVKTSSRDAEPGWEYVENRFGGAGSSRTELTTGNRKKNSGSKLIRIVVGAALVCFGVVYLTCVISLFVMNDQFENATSTIFDEIDAAHSDALSYIELTQEQITAVFVTSFDEFAKSLGINCGTCDPTTNPFCNLCTVGDNLRLQSINFNEALNEVPINGTKEDLFEVEKEFDQARSAVFQSINGINSLLLLFLLLVSIGFVFYAFSATKKIGNVLVTCALVFIFTIGWLIWLFCIAVFYLGGGMAVIVPGAFENIVNNGSLVNGNHSIKAVEYTLPNVPHILQTCKDSESAYEVFNLTQVYDIENIPFELCEALCTLPDVRCDVNKPCIHGMDLDCIKFPQAIVACEKAKGYSDFVEDAIRWNVGTCEPLYNVINSTVHIFSYQLGSPVGGYWFGLNLLLFLVYPIVILTIVLQEMLNQC